MATQSRDNDSVEFEKRKQEILNAVSEKLRLHFGRTVEEATENHLYKAVALVARDEIVGKWAATRSARVKQHKKRVYYLSIEFLIGRSLGCNLINLCQDKAFAAALGELGVTIPELEDMEPEAALGNGGLGRLAACFMDSLATLDLPAMGCGIRYEYGLFKQFIVDGQQMELPDSWLDDGNIWEVPVPDDAMDIVFGGRVVEDWSEGRLRVRYEDATHVTAVPYDIPVLGYDTDTALSLRLWSAKSTKSLDMDAFASGDYMRASQEKELAEVISKVLYPADDHLQGKTLRLKQHYFFTSATVQYIIKDYKKRYPGRPLSLLADKVVIHINDTHPALAIPELMRILMDEEGMGFDEAYRVTHERVLLHEPHDHGRGARKVARTALPRASAAHLADHRRDQRALLPRPGAPLPGADAAHQRHGDHRLRSGPHGKPRRCDEPLRQRRLRASRADPARRPVPQFRRLRRQVHRHHQRHHAAALADEGEPRSFGSSGRDDRHGVAARS